MNRYILMLLIVVNSFLFSIDKKSDFKLKTSNNIIIEIDKVKNGLNFKNFDNKLVILVFFGHNCPPCLHEMPILTRLYKDLKDDIEIVALEVQGMRMKELATYRDMKKISYHFISGLDSLPFIQYIQNEVNWEGIIPFSVIFNRKGEAKYVKPGVMTYKQFKAIIKKIDK